MEFMENIKNQHIHIVMPMANNNIRCVVNN